MPCFINCVCVQFFNVRFYDYVVTSYIIYDFAARDRFVWCATNVDGAGDWYQKSKGARQITPEQYLQWYAKNQGVGDSNKPKVSVQKYLFQPEEIQSLIDDTLKSVLGRKATDSENKEFYTAIQGMIDAGTITTTKKVGGKTVTETKPGYTKEKAQALIKKSVEEKAPQDLAEKQSLDFADFLSGLGG